MDIARAKLEEKLKGLREQLEQLKANANAVSGAILLAEDLLKEETPSEPPKE